MNQRMIPGRFILPVIGLVLLLTGCGEAPPPPEKPQWIREFVNVPLPDQPALPNVTDLLAPNGELEAVGTTRGLLLRRDNGSWGIQNLGRGESQSVTCLASGKANQFFVGTTDGMYESSSGRGFLYHDIGHVLSIAVTPDGNVWCGTKVGLRVRLGNEWRTFRKSSSGSGSNGLPHDEVRHLAVDDQGKLWAGTVQGVASFELKGEAIATDGKREPIVDIRAYTGSTYVPLVSGGLVVQAGNTAMEGNTVTRLICLGEEMMIATNRGISRTKGFQGFEVFSADSQEPARMADGSLGYKKVKGNCPMLSNFVRDMSISPDGRLLIGSKQGISIYSLAGGTWETILPGDLGFPGGVVNVIRPAAGGGFWAGTDRGLFRLEERLVETGSTPDGKP